VNFKVSEFSNTNGPPALEAAGGHLEGANNSSHWRPRRGGIALAFQVNDVGTGCDLAPAFPSSAGLKQQQDDNEGVVLQ